MRVAPSGGRNRRTRLAVCIAASAAAALTVAGCAASSSGSKSDGGSGASTGSADSLHAAQQTGLAYTGGKAGAADSSLSRIKIGFINQQGATPGFPEATAAAQAAASFVNDYLGGIGGHPIQLVTCFVVSSEEDGQNCAQKMAADSSIVAVQLGLLTVGQGSVYKILQGRKPIIGGAPTSPVDISQTSVPFYFSGVANWPSIALYEANTLKAKSVALVYDGKDPGAQVAAQLAGSVLKSHNVAYKSVPSSGSGDWSSALTSAGARTADAVTFIGSPPTCVPFANAVNQLAIKAKVVTLDFCASGAVKTALGHFPPWTYAFQVHNPYAPEQDPQVAAYRAAMAKYQPQAAFTTAYPFSNLMVLAKLMNGLGATKLTGPAITGAVLGITTPIWAGAQSPHCGFLSSTKNPAYCSTDTFLYSYDDSGWSKPTVASWQGN
jgi:branched-chain amino acid transport system substrate-binding protein